MLKKSHLITIAGAVAMTCGLAFAHDSVQHTQVQPAAAPAEQTPAQAQADAPLTPSEITKVSEAFGHFIGRNIKTPGITLDLDSIIKGLRDGAAGKPAPMSDKEYEGLMTRLQMSAYKKVSEDNLKAANEFLDKNSKEKGVVVVEPGKLQYIILTPGTGAVVKEHDSPQIQYTGKYIDGTSFGSSADAGGPITIPLDQTIPGFSKGIAGMKEGEKRKLFVHPDVGYGTTGHLSPNSLLIFEVEVLKANAPEDKDAKSMDTFYENDTSDDDMLDDDYQDEEAAK